MKRKGFTLVELLAVIVILAVIALIAVPMIVGVIEKSRRGALQNSGYGLVEAGNLYNAQYQNAGTVRFDIKDNEVDSEEENKLVYKGNVKEGTVLINNKGKVVVCINDGKYAAYKNFEDTKVTIVDNKTCTIPENSNIVYLDNEATIDTNINDLIARIESLESTVKDQKAEIDTLKEEKSNNIDVTNSINNLTTTHNSDISSINTRLEALTQSINNNKIESKFHPISEYYSFTSSTDLIYTGANITIPANSYYCLTASSVWENGASDSILINSSSTSISAGNILAQNANISGYAYKLSTTACGYTSNESKLYIWEQHKLAAKNAIYLKGFYIN